MAHPIVHIEIPSTNSKEMADFYSKVFGWSMQTDTTFDYTMFNSGEGSPGGGFASVSAENPVGSVLVHIGSDDLDESLRQIKANGGQVVMEPQEIPGIGWWATFKDPAGNRLALYKSMQEG
jgi:predicted enzyme related to lactoylglutathione lyase